jgi:plastocyanin
MNALVWTSAVLLSALSVASCGGKGGGGNPADPSSNLFTIAINGQTNNFSFSPNPADAGGKTVVFKNNTAEAHRVVLNNDPSTDTGNIAPGATSRSVTMPTAGTNYHCSVHDKMGGAIVPQSGGAPPPCEGVYCY